MDIINLALWSPGGIQSKAAGSPSDYVRGDDILDIWFDSGASWAAVLEGSSSHHTHYWHQLSVQQTGQSITSCCSHEIPISNHKTQIQHK